MMQRSSPGGDGERHLVGRDHAAEALGQCLGREDGVRHRQPPFSRARRRAPAAPRQSRASVTMMPRGKNSITATRRTPMITSAYWLPADDSE